MHLLFQQVSRRLPMAINVILKAITPIHIGSGNKVQPYEYIFHNGKLYLINIDNCLKYIKAKVGYNLFYQKINEWLEDVSRVLENQAGSKPRDTFNLSIFDFVRSSLKDQNLARELETEVPKNKDLHVYSLYSDRKPSHEVSSLIKTASNLPYIPGSSFKGFLKTSILNFLVSKYFNGEFFGQYFQERINKFQHDKKQADIKHQRFNPRKYLFDSEKEVENECFSCKFADQQGKISYDAKYDLFKFIQVSDFYPENNDCMKFVELKPVPSRSRSNLSLSLETIKEGTSFFGSINIKVEELKELHRNFSKISKTKWIGIEDKFRKLFNFDFNQLPSLSSVEIERQFLNNVLVEIIEDSSAAIINKDLDWIAHTNFQGKERLDSFYDTLPKNAVKIGFSSGFHAVTIYDALCNSDNGLDIKGKYQSFLKTLGVLKNNIDQFPKHRKIIELAPGKIATFGWISVDFNI